MRILYVLPLVFLMGCKLTITSTDGGVVQWDDQSCNQSTPCSIEFDPETGYHTQLEAIPDTDFTFSHWEGYAPCDKNTLCTFRFTLSMDLDRVERVTQISAIFVPETPKVTIFEHAFYPGHGPTSTETFLELDELGPIQHIFHTLEEPLSCEGTGNERYSAAEEVEKVHRSLPTSHFFVWDFREDCSWECGPEGENFQGGKTGGRIVVGDLIFTKQISYLGWNPNCSIRRSEESRLLKHEFHHQEGRQHCDLAAAGQPCL